MIEFTEIETQILGTAIINYYEWVLEEQRNIMFNIQKLLDYNDPILNIKYESLTQDLDVKNQLIVEIRNMCEKMGIGIVGENGTEETI